MAVSFLNAICWIFMAVMNRFNNSLDSKKELQPLHVHLFNLSLFVLTLHWQRPRGLKPVASALHFDFSLSLIFPYRIVSAGKAAVTVLFFWGHFLFETVHDLWQRGHTCQTKIALKSRCRRRSESTKSMNSVIHF